MSRLLASFGRALPLTPFARNVSILAGGTAAGQIVVVLAAPLLTRLYGPEDFGLLAAFTSMLGIFVVVSSLRYQFAIPLPEDEQEAAHVVALCLLLALGTTLLSVAIVLLFGPAIARALNLPLLEHYLWLLPPAVLLAGIYELLSYWAVRVKAFSAIARTKLAQALSMTLVQVGGFAFGPLALLVGHATGNAAGVTTLGALALRRWQLFLRVRPAGVLRAASRYRRFPLFSTWGAAFNTLSTQTPPLLFAALFGPAVAGLYVLAQRVLAMPMTLVGDAVSDVFFSDAADARRQGSIGPLVAAIYEKLAQIAMPPALVLLLIGPELFALVFGQSWREAGVFAQWMAPWLYLQFVSSPLSAIFDVLEKQPQEMAFQATLLTTRIIALVLGARTGGVTEAVAYFALGSAICYLGQLCWIFLLSRSGWRALWRPSLRALIWSALLVSPLALAVGLAVSPEVLMAAAGLVMVLLAVRYMALLRTAR